jgi:hypothetical protein
MSEKYHDIERERRSEGKTARRRLNLKLTVAKCDFPEKNASAATMTAPAPRCAIRYTSLRTSAGKS